jgi:hypothetical protein
MAEQPQRPRFRDGQPLAAADLELVVDQERDRDARHDRALHTPGIALGLQLATEDLPMSFNGSTVVTKRITVTAGVADDGNGTQAVLAADTPLAPTQFEDDVGSTGQVDPEASVPGATYPYPVLLTAEDHDGPAPAFAAEGCGAATGPTRVIEDVRIRIGRRGEHITLAAQRPLGPGDSLADAAPFRLLLGFVRYHPGLKRYVELVGELDNIRARRAGVRAGEVVTAGDQLLLRVGEPAVPGQPALVLEAANGGQLRFGRSTADGGVDPVLTSTTAGSMTVNGSLTVNGTLNPGPVVGTLRVQSGVATDGMPLPLPPGVTAADVQAGKWALHVQVTPRFPQPSPPPANVAYLVTRCDVDAGRVVHCEFRRLTTGSSALDPVVPAACNFLVAAAVVASAAGASP